MNIDGIKKKVREALSELSTPVDIDKIKDEDSLQETHGFDSIILLEYMILLEEKFEIQFDEDFELENLDSIKRVSDYIMNNYSDMI